ncbi:hypothetical protein ODJ79_24015 [Actinoplanes sp. KI2]|uniref:hypothetical protein n=1 Tax=Actinoplanes sp. KI2 TaxID=2983315 RepID=UPI0021D6108C|nr:hypothetical protein [Actinoplanes sp. KI2]MCU7726807.1 hypothetical protein [Actinoplanes sp. KI2]
MDPLAGPLEAFAYDLRKVRADAGNPTYRTLAKVAGYSATTLSEAAGGARKPTLDVVLAYVGACRGDCAYWRSRWEALPEPAATSPAVSELPVALSAEDAGLPSAGQAGSQVRDEAGAEADRTAGSPPVSADPAPPAATGWRRRRWRVLAPLAAVLLVATGGAIVLLQRKESNGCPRAVPHPVFAALTYGAGARVHTGAVRDAPVTTTIPGGCTVGFVGYCLGEKIHDNTGGSPDLRWFKLSDDRVIASGIVHGNPPPGLAPSHCTDDHPGPNAIALSVTGSHALQLSATGTGLEIVGFAALFDPDGDQPGERRWRQVAFTEKTADRPRFTARWTAVPAQDGKPVLVAAAACMGGDGPTGVVTARTVTGAGFPEATLAPADRASAAAAACSYPA